MNLASLLVAQGSVQSAGPTALDWALYATAGISTVALLVIGWIRRKQISPLTKCLALSLHAHVLLFIFASTTRVTVERPAPTTTTLTPMRLVEWDESWEQVADETPPTDDPTATATLTETEIESPVGENEPTNERLPERVITAAAPAISESAAEIQPVAAAERSTRSTFDPVSTADYEPPVAEAIPEAQAFSAMSSPQNSQSAATPSTGSFADEVWDDRLGAPPLDATAELFEVTRIDVPETTSFAELEAGMDRMVPPVSTETVGVERIDRDPAWIDSAPLIDTAPQRNQPMESGSLQNWLRENSAPPRLGDGAPIPNLFRLRSVAAAKSFPPETTWESEQAVDAGLNWLVRNQDADGRWDASRFGAGREDRVLDQDRGGAGGEADTGISGLALLALLGRGNTHLEGPYRDSVQRGLEFLIRSQRDDGDLSGDAEFFARMYSHGIATIALSEALALTGDPRLAEPTRRALEFSRQAQDPQTGGWRYRPRERGDMSQFGWQVLALVSGEQAGIRIPESTRLGMHRFLDACSSGRAGGRCSYRSGEAVSATMTAEGLACRYFLDYQRDPGRVREAVETALVPDAGHSASQPDLYYLYYVSLALHQHGGPRWESWNEELHRMILPRQRQGNTEAGSWDPDTRWGGYGGRVYSTAMAILCLEIPYRHLPLYRLDEPLAGR